MRLKHSKQVESLIPFSAGQRVTEVHNGTHRIVNLIDNVSERTVVAENGHVYDRLTGGHIGRMSSIGVVAKRDFYRAIHTPGYGEPN